MEKIYLDANVFSHIIQRTAGIDDSQVSKFESAISSRFILPVSPVVLDEVIAVYRSSSGAAESILDCIARYCDLRMVLKPSDQILREAIEGNLAGRELDKVSPFFNSEDEVVRAIQSFFHGTHSIGGLKQVVEMVDSQKQEFYEGMVEANKKTRQELGIVRGKKLPDFKEGRPPTFDEFFERIAPGFAEAAAKRVGLLQKAREIGVVKLLELRSVRAFSGISASWAYSQIIEGRKLERSAGYDMRHAVLASATDVLITNDGEFRRLMERIPLSGFNVCTFSDFVRQL